MEGLLVKSMKQGFFQDLVRVETNFVLRSYVRGQMS